MNALEKTKYSIELLDQELNELRALKPDTPTRQHDYTRGYERGYRDAIRVIEARQTLLRTAVDIAEHLAGEVSK